MIERAEIITEGVFRPGVEDVEVKYVMSGRRPDRVDRLHPLASDRVISEATPVSVMTNVGQMIEFVKRSGAADAGVIVDLHSCPSSGVSQPRSTDVTSWRNMARLLAEEFPSARYLGGVHGVGRQAAAFLELRPPRGAGLNRLVWQSNTRGHEIALFSADSLPVEAGYMVDTSRLIALLQLDERGEYLVEMLSRILVDRRKRRRLLIRLLEIEDEGGSVQEDPVLTRSEAEVLRIIQDAMRPLSTAEVQELAQEGDSLRRYRQHVSAVLNDLTTKGLLGKVRGGPGRVVYFALPRESIRLALAQLGQTPDECEFERLREITELPYSVLLEIVEDMRSP